MATAIITGSFIAAKYVERFGYSRATVWNMLFWVLIPAFLGARLYFVFIQKPWTPDGVGYYLQHPEKILAVWDGGIHIYGGFIGGLIGIYAYMRRYRLPMPLYLDAIALALPLSQSIGRLGNFVNQELYGPPTTLPWGLRIDAIYRLPPYNNLILYPASTRFQPLFLYEGLWNLAGFGILWYITHRHQEWVKRGDVLLMYMIISPAIRFILEFSRTDSWFIIPNLHINAVHLLAFAMVTGAALTLYLRHRTPPAQADFFIQTKERIIAWYQQARIAWLFLQQLELPEALPPSAFDDEGNIIPVTAGIPAQVQSLRVSLRPMQTMNQGSTNRAKINVSKPIKSRSRPSRNGHN